jgi:hypothetical protein
MLADRRLFSIPILHLALLTLLYLGTRLPLLTHLPFVMDEGVYAMMIDEQRVHLTMVPTFLDSPVSWKMAPFFWLYSFLTTPHLGLGVEADYRWPSLIFGFGCAMMVYLLIRHASNEDSALLGSLLFLAPFASLYPDTSLLIDSAAMLLVMGSIYFYIVKKSYLPAGILALLAFSFKLLLGFIPMIVVAGHLLFSGKKEELKDKALLLSFALPFIGLVLNYILLMPYGGGAQVYLSELLPRLISSTGYASITDRLLASLDTLAYSAGPIFLLSLFGFAKKWKESPFFSVWYVFSAFILLASATYPWYFFAVLPAWCYFAVLAVSSDGKTSLAGKSVLAVVAVSSLLLAIGAYGVLLKQHSPERSAGLAIAGKENTLIIGHFKPGILAYKTIEERRVFGYPLDFGYVLGPPSFMKEEAASFIVDYHNASCGCVDGSFSGMYTQDSVFRKTTNLTRFDVVVLSGDLGFTLSMQPDYHEQDVWVYSRKG